jgi:trehalose synthase
LLPLVNVGHKALGDYATLVSRGLMNEIERLAEPLQGKRVVHVSATAFGGGVAEINYTLVPLMADAGLDVEWRIIHGEDEFFNVTKAIHNGLQGAERPLDEEEQAIFARFNRENAAQFSETDYDFVIIHDPQPVAMIDSFPDRRAKWIWRGHIDFSTPNEQIFDVLLPSIRRFDAAIFHMRDYVPHADLPMAVIWPPAIDPLMPKNMALSPEDAAYIVDQFGIDVERPLLTQVSRFDPWKDPPGVIDAYRLVKERVPEVQLALVGSMAHDDPEGWDYYKRTVEHADGDPDIYILSNMNNVGAVEVNAFQVHSHALIQKSTKEGFGLTVTEALWKARPMVAGRVGGIVAQIDNGTTGWLVDSVDECASACVEILRDPDEARGRALRGKEHVRRHFLTPRLLRDWLVLFNKLAGNDTGGSEITVV